MRAEMHSRNLACPQLEKTLHLAASLIEVRIPSLVLFQVLTHAPIVGISEIDISRKDNPCSFQLVCHRHPCF